MKLLLLILTATALAWGLAQSHILFRVGGIGFAEPGCVVGTCQAPAGFGLKHLSGVMGHRPVLFAEVAARRVGGRGWVGQLETMEYKAEGVR